VTTCFRDDQSEKWEQKYTGHQPTGKREAGSLRKIPFHFSDPIFLTPATF